MDEPVLRPARREDVASITRCAEAAYAKYVPRMDRKPAPMVADFAAHVGAGEVHVAETGGEVRAYMVTMAHPDCVFVDNIAVHPDHQGSGLGRRLMALAESQARRLGLGNLRLYTNTAMTENLDFYGGLVPTFPEA